MQWYEQWAPVSFKFRFQLILYFKQFLYIYPSTWQIKRILLYFTLTTFSRKSIHSPKHTYIKHPNMTWKNGNISEISPEPRDEQSFTSVITNVRKLLSVWVYTGAYLFFVWTPKRDIRCSCKCPNENGAVRKNDERSRFCHKNSQDEGKSDENTKCCLQKKS